MTECVSTSYNKNLCKKWIYKGYVNIYFPKHPFARNGNVLEHRIVMEKMIGRYLRKGEEVHHKNKIKSDNSESNLILISKSHHLSIHKKGNTNRIGKHKDMSNRRCFECGSNKTRVEKPTVKTKHKTPCYHWYKIDINNNVEWLCDICYKKRLSRAPR